MAVHKILQLCTIAFLGILYATLRCDARAVNVSNTWTMPQEGLNVFYRFFRDRISWFEADAVCQFHHANLVTVDNSFQFDATRDLLRELDVNDIVWIGLMRPQSSERFMWSNSRPLVADTGYWAESLPLMDAPLCAVIDPIRDYRWHALRCGGPETASFLCEMPVPSWADACILKDMPNLTMQYMADTASIELIRNCEEEGLLRQTCKGKQDRERAIRELICPRERQEAQRINDITNSHFKSLQIINNIRTDNNENNDIELLPMEKAYGLNNDFTEQSQTEKNTVQRLIEQFNVDELMQADEPGYKIPGEIPKPVKKTAKKVLVVGQYPKKDKIQKNTERQQQQQQQKHQKIVPLEDMMMGDQPLGEPEMLEHVPDDEVSNEIMEPLPHKKKILLQDLKTMAPITEKKDKKTNEEKKKKSKAEDEDKGRSKDDEKVAAVAEDTTTSTTLTTTTTITTTTTTPQVTNSNPTQTTTAGPPTTNHVTSEEYSPTLKDVTSIKNDASQTTTGLPTATLPTATIGHPMHPQQPRSNIITEETQHPHIKESADNSHFIPPMLLVKSHYVPPLKHEHGATEHQEQHSEAELDATTTINLDTTAAETSRVEHSSTHVSTQDDTDAAAGTDIAATTDAVSTMKQDEVSTMPTTTKPMVATVQAIAAVKQLNKYVKILDNSAPTSNQEATQQTVKTTTILKPIKNTAINKSHIADADISAATSTTIIVTTTSAEIQSSTVKPLSIVAETTQERETTKPTSVAPETSTEHESATQKLLKPATSSATMSTTEHKEDIAITSERAELLHMQTEAMPAEQDKQEAIAATTEAPFTTTAAAVTMTSPPPPITTPTTPAAFTEEVPTTTHNFLKEETEAPFKPNRRRSLTKPETASYFKKILG